MYKQFPAYTIRWINVGLTLVHRLRRWINVKPMLIQRLVSAGLKPKVFQIEIIINVLVNSFRVILNTYGIGLLYFKSHSAWISLRRQILTSKDDPRTARVNVTESKWGYKFIRSYILLDCASTCILIAWFVRFIVMQLFILHVLLNYPSTFILTLRTLMSTTADILRLHWHLYKQLLKVKCAFNFETLLYARTLISQITKMFSHLKLWIAVARHNFKWLNIQIE